MSTQNPFIKIQNQPVGLDFPTYFIADVAANHDGDINRAKKLIELAKINGADAVKFQHHNVKKYVSDRGFKSLGGKISHQKNWSKSVFDVYKDAEVPLDWTETLKVFCDKMGITFFTTPYDLDIVDHIDPFVPAFKIGSGDIAWNAILEKVASKGKPVLIATGASTLIEVVNAYQKLACMTKNIVLMQCNTNYTASNENFKYINLNVLKLYHQMFPNIVLGLSDHTHGHETVLGAVTLGARVIEKHFTDDTTRVGPDHKFSMDPKSWADMVNSTRLLELALGDGIKKIEDNEKEAVILQRRAIRVIRDLEKGEKITINDIEFQRPCPNSAIQPNDISFINGMTISRKIETGEHLQVEDFV